VRGWLSRHVQLTPIASTPFILLDVSVITDNWNCLTLINREHSADLKQCQDTFINQMNTDPQHYCE
jgi:hypothetical protein